MHVIVLYRHDLILRHIIVPIIIIRVLVLVGSVVSAFYGFANFLFLFWSRSQILLAVQLILIRCFIQYAQHIIRSSAIGNFLHIAITRQSSFQYARQ